MSEDWPGDGFCRRCNAEIADPVWRSRHFCARRAGQWTMDMGEHDEETRAEHNALMDHEARLWNRRIEWLVAHGQPASGAAADEWAKRRKHLRVVSEP